MTTKNHEDLALYKGDGEKLESRGGRLASYEPLTGEELPENYIASSGLRDAVNVALALGQPLLITGEPGTGKTRLARSVAWELDLHYLEFHTKTTSTASDLFYHYDALRRFQDVHAGDKKSLEEYITPTALGLAILLANPTEKAVEILPDDLKTAGPVRSVVLIDEIDKAPRDLPNDVLDEIEKMKFRVKEAPWEPFEADTAYRPVILMTSNSEKNLPEAFLRRCVFYHIPFPDADTLKRIVRRRFGDGKDPAFSEAFLNAAVDRFEAIRNLHLKKKPATAEFLGWISILKALGVPLDKPGEMDRDKLKQSLSVLAKGREDLQRLRGELPSLFSLAG